MTHAIKDIETNPWSWRQKEKPRSPSVWKRLYENRKKNLDHHLYENVWRPKFPNTLLAVAYHWRLHQVKRFSEEAQQLKVIQQTNWTLIGFNLQFNGRVVPHAAYRVRHGAGRVDLQIPREHQQKI